MGENIAKSGVVTADSSVLRKARIDPKETVVRGDVPSLCDVTFPAPRSESQGSVPSLSTVGSTDGSFSSEIIHAVSPLSAAALPQFERERALPALMAERLLPLRELPSGVTIYGPDGMEPQRRLPERPVKVAILTSIRDVGVEEGVGRCWEPGRRETYLKGTIETALEAVNDDRLGDFVEIVAIITDDMGRDLRGSSYVASPNHDGTWIFPRELRNRGGELATSLTVNIPSTFRALPRLDIPGRLEEKAHFESQILAIMQQSGADILVSDHFLARIQFLIDPDFHGLLGRVLNTHPGITREDHPYSCRGKSPDEVALQHLRGERVLEDGTTIKVRPHRWAGASFHFVTPTIDAGPVLCDGELTKLSVTDTSRDISRKIYATSKEPVFIEGLRHYVVNVFPEIERAVPLRGEGSP